MGSYFSEIILVKLIYNIIIFNNSIKKMRGRVNEKARYIIGLFSVSYKLFIQSSPPRIVVWLGQELTNVAPGTNSIQLNDAIKEMFDTAQPGDSFDVKVIARYEHRDSGESYEISYPNTQYVYVPNPI